MKEFANVVFYKCELTLEQLANSFNITYKEINVWIFCIIEPIIFLCMCYIIINQYLKLKK